MGATNEQSGAGADKNAPKAMTAAEAASRVKRTWTERKPVMRGSEQARDKDGVLLFDDVPRQAKIGVDEVLSFKDYGDHVVVVTTDGKKFSNKDE